MRIQLNWNKSKPIPLSAIMYIAYHANTTRKYRFGCFFVYKRSLCCGIILQMYHTTNVSFYKGTRYHTTSVSYYKCIISPINHTTNLSYALCKQGHSRVAEQSSPSAQSPSPYNKLQERTISTTILIAIQQ